MAKLRASRFQSRRPRRREVSTFPRAVLTLSSCVNGRLTEIIDYRQASCEESQRGGWDRYPSYQLEDRGGWGWGWDFEQRDLKAAFCYLARNIRWWRDIAIRELLEYLAVLANLLRNASLLNKRILEFFPIVSIPCVLCVPSSYERLLPGDSVEQLLPLPSDLLFPFTVLSQFC